MRAVKTLGVAALIVAVAVLLALSAKGKPTLFYLSLEEPGFPGAHFEGDFADRFDEIYAGDMLTGQAYDIRAGEFLVIDTSQSEVRPMAQRLADEYAAKGVVVLLYDSLPPLIGSSTQSTVYFLDGGAVRSTLLAATYDAKAGDARHIATELRQFAPIPDTAAILVAMGLTAVLCGVTFLALRGRRRASRLQYLVAALAIATAAVLSLFLTFAQNTTSQLWRYWYTANGFGLLTFRQTFLEESMAVAGIIASVLYWGYLLLSVAGVVGAAACLFAPRAPKALRALTLCAPVGAGVMVLLSAVTVMVSYLLAPSMFQGSQYTYTMNFYFLLPPAALAFVAVKRVGRGERAEGVREPV